MTPDERALLQGFLRDLVQTRGTDKDPEANGMIAEAMRASPDAAYLLVQHAILSDQALHAAQDRIAAMQSSAQSGLPAAAPDRFSRGPSPWAQAASQPPPQSQPQWQTQAPPQPSRGFFGPGPFSSGGGLGSFLRNAGTTAAGVAGGEMLFQGLSGLFGGNRGFGGGGLFGGGGFGGGGFGGGEPVEDVTNNYYSGDDQSGGGFDPGGGGWDDNSANDT